MRERERCGACKKKKFNGRKGWEEIKLSTFLKDNVREETGEENNSGIIRVALRKIEERNTIPIHGGEEQFCVNQSYVGT